MVFSLKYTASGGYWYPTAIAVYPDGGELPSSIDSQLAMSSEWGSDYITRVSLDVTEGTVYRIVGVQLVDVDAPFTISWSGDLVLPHPKPTVIRIR